MQRADPTESYRTFKNPIAQFTGAEFFGISLRPPWIIFVFAHPRFGAERRRKFQHFRLAELYTLSLMPAGIIKTVRSANNYLILSDLVVNRRQIRVTALVICVMV